MNIDKVKGLLRDVVNMPSIILFFVLVIVAGIIAPNFLTLGNLSNFLSGAAVLLTLAIGMTYLIINGHFDLSIGSILAFSCALAITTQAHSIAYSVVVALIGGTLLGLINGLLVGKAGINSFIVTLAGMIGYRGLTYIVTGERGYIGTREAFNNFGVGQLGPIPYMIFICAALLIISHIVLKYTRHGRETYAVGGNVDAARDSGTRTGTNVVINFTIMGFCAALAGVFFAAKLNMSVPYIGDEYVMMTIAAVVLGGTKLTGGSGGIVQTIFGVLSVQVINNIMQLFYLPSKYSNLVLGFVLLVVVYWAQRQVEKERLEKHQRKVGEI